MNREAYDYFSKRYPTVFKLAFSISEKIAFELQKHNLDGLARFSPGLKAFDWGNYLRLSSIRMAKTADALLKNLKSNSKILDFGSYFGNFSLLLKELGFEVIALDSYEKHKSSLGWVVNLLKANKINTVEFEEINKNNNKYFKKNYDAVICMGVIEHIPFTPRNTLATINNYLREEGFLILDTPNLAYFYKREMLSHGISIHLPIEQQFCTDIPFEGHNREYTKDEIIWLLNKINHKIISIEIFNYSIFGKINLTQDDMTILKKMDEDETLKEIIFSVSQKNKINRQWKNRYKIS